MQPLNLPKMTIQSVYEYDKPLILDEMSKAKTLVTFYQTLEGEGRLLFTGIGDNELLLLIHLIHRHVQFYNLFESVMETIRKFRANEKDALEFLAKVSKYLHLKNKEN